MSESNGYSAGWHRILNGKVGDFLSQQGIPSLLLFGILWAMVVYVPDTVKHMFDASQSAEVEKIRMLTDAYHQDQARDKEERDRIHQDRQRLLEELFRLRGVAGSPLVPREPFE